jgi:hypothetical protein
LSGSSSAADSLRGSIAPVRDVSIDTPGPVALPTSLPAPAAAASSAAVTPVEARPGIPSEAESDRDVTAIRSVINRYRAAFTGLNVPATVSIWPTVDSHALSKAFDQLSEQRIEFDHCAFSVTGALAVATCGGTATFVPKVGNKTPHLDSRVWTFRLVKKLDGWVIGGVDAR